jgi:hypothetical protein
VVVVVASGRNVTDCSTAKLLVQKMEEVDARRRQPQEQQYKKNNFFQQQQQHIGASEGTKG